MSTGNSIQATKTETGWIFTKGDSKVVVKDTDGDGIFTKSDKIVSSSVSGNSIFTGQDIAYAQRSTILNSDTEIDVNTFVQALPTQNELNQQQYQTQQQTAQPQKKTGWQKFAQGLGLGFNFLLGATGSILGAFSGFGAHWAYNSTSWNDWRVRGFSNMSNNLVNTSTMMSGAALNYGAMLNTAMQQQNSYMQQYQTNTAQLIEKQNIETQKAQEEAKQKAENAKIVSAVEDLYKIANDDEDNLKLNETNSSFIKDAYDVTAESYTDEQAAITKKIAQYPQLPHDAVASNDEEKGKLSGKLAQMLNDLIYDYKHTNKADMTDGDYQYINNYILEAKARKGQLNEADIKALKDILKKYAA